MVNHRTPFSGVMFVPGLGYVEVPNAPRQVGRLGRPQLGVLSGAAGAISGSLSGEMDVMMINGLGNIGQFPGSRQLYQAFKSIQTPESAAVDRVVGVSTPPRRGEPGTTDRGRPTALATEVQSQKALKADPSALQIKQLAEAASMLADQVVAGSTKAIASGDASTLSDIATSAAAACAAGDRARALLPLIQDPTAAAAVDVKSAFDSPCTRAKAALAAANKALLPTQVIAAGGGGGGGRAGAGGGSTTDGGGSATGGGATQVALESIGQSPWFAKLSKLTKESPIAVAGGALALGFVVLQIGRAVFQRPSGGGFYE